MNYFVVLMVFFVGNIFGWVSQHKHRMKELDKAKRDLYSNATIIKDGYIVDCKDCPFVKNRKDKK